MKTILTLLFVIFFADANAQCTPVIHYDGCDIETVDQWKYISFQWYKGTVPIEDAVEFTYEPIEVGMYMVRTVDLNGCVGYSKRYKILNWCGVGKSKN